LEAFYRYIAPYPPFNRHYEGDLGSLLLPLGVALLIASRTPTHHGSLIWFASTASALHAVNHVGEAVERATVAEWLLTTLPLTVFAVLLVWSARIVSSIEKDSPSSSQDPVSRIMAPLEDRSVTSGD